MRLPIEDDWKPQLGNKEVEENEYERHVRVLAESLREAHKVAGQQSRLSHETAKRHYDRQTRLEQFRKGDFVYIHDPTHKRGKAKKFSYQYKGPYEIEQKISSLIYKVRLEDGTSTVINVNRLKRACGQAGVEKELPSRKRKYKVVKLDQPKQSSDKGDKLPETMGLDMNIPSYSELIEGKLDSTSEIEDEGLNSLSREKEDDSDWDPGSSYLQRKLRNDKPTADVAHHLRSRIVNRSGQETGNDKAGAEMSDPAGNASTPDDTSFNESRSGVCHSYNLRSRNETSLGDKQMK